MTEEKRPQGGLPVIKDEGRYAVVPNGSIITVAEAEGHVDLSPEVATLLAEDVTYHLREIIQNASQYMRHSKRKRLNVEDLNRALRSADVQPVFGHGAPEGVPWRQTKEGELNFVEDLDLTLPNVACNSQVPNNLGCTTVRANWLVIEGSQKGIAASQPIQGKVNGKLTKGVSDELMQYHEQVTKAILGSDQELMKHALTDLRTNPNISPLLPYLVEFVSSWVKTINYDPAKLTKMLYTIQAIISNEHLFLEPQPYLSLLIEVVVYSLVEPPDSALSSFSDHWVIRDYAARMLAKICRQWASEANKLRDKMLGVLSDVLHDVNRPFTAHYGAILALCYFGEKALRDILLPYLPVYWHHVMVTLKDITLYKDKLDAHKVHGVLLCASALIVKHFDTSYLQNATVVKKQTKEPKPVKKEPGLFDIPDSSVKIRLEMDSTENSEASLVSESEEIVTKPRCYLQFYEQFGESLLPQLPCLSCKGFKRAVVKEEKEVSLSDADSHRTGEEMLQEFLTHIPRPGGLKTEKIPFFKMESTASSDLEVSNNSDERSSYEGDDSHLTVKATVSDPSKGIKLFISKKRSKVKEEETKKKGLRGKGDGKSKQPDSVQSQLQDAFELTPLRHRKSIRFGFSPVDWKGNPQTIYRYSKRMSLDMPYPVKSEYRKLCLSLKPYGNRATKGKSKGKSCRDCYSPSSLEYVL